MINQRLATLHFPNEDPLGKTIRLTELAPSNPPTGWATIVGIVPNARQRFQFGDARRTACPIPWSTCRCGAIRTPIAAPGFWFAHKATLTALVRSLNTSVGKAV
jgi:hypothetical protein